MACYFGDCCTAARCSTNVAASAFPARSGVPGGGPPLALFLQLQIIRN
jgi:hypothetical protein